MWKWIFGYKNLYKISNTGKVKSIRNNKILKPSISQGYYFVILQKNGQKKFKQVHRLVAKAFIPNPKRYPVINHKDENKLNNKVSNLEWCTIKYNTNYGTCRLKISNNLKGRKPWNKGKTGVMSAKARKKISIARKGSSLSNDTKNKISKSLKRYYKNLHSSS